VALLITLLATFLLTALGVGMVLVTNTETLITANYTESRGALYTADAGVERVVQDLLLTPRWNDILTGMPDARSAFHDGASSVTLADGSTLTIASVTSALQSATDLANIWGANDPVWRGYAAGRMSDLLPSGSVRDESYLIAYVGDDPSESDGDPLSDTNGVLSLHVEAFGENGARKVIETTVARTSSTEIERGYIAQRGQEEWSQRARKAAVQTPGKGLTNMRMNVAAGQLAVQ
jgi:Tfp pilus assembly protein PilX